MTTPLILHSCNGDCQRTQLAGKQGIFADRRLIIAQDLALYMVVSTVCVMVCSAATACLGCFFI